MKVLTWCCILAGALAMWGGMSATADPSGSSGPGMVIACIGACGVGAGWYTLRVTDRFTRLAQVTGGRRAIVASTVIAGGAVAAAVLLVPALIWAAVQANEEA